MHLATSSEADATNDTSVQLTSKQERMKVLDSTQPSSEKESAKESDAPSCLKLISSKDEEQKSPDRKYLESLLNKSMKLKITDGRVLVGIFLCSDKDRNIILGSCQEHIKEPELSGEEPRILGLAMVPGKHITAMYVDQS